MNLQAFQDLIDRLGEDLGNWPDADRAAATDLLRASFDAQVALYDARRLRVALSAPPVRAPAGLADRIFTAACKADEPSPLGQDDIFAA